MTQDLSIAASKFVQGRLIAMNHRMTKMAIHDKNAKLDAINVPVEIEVVARNCPARSRRSTWRRRTTNVPPDAPRSGRNSST